MRTAEKIPGSRAKGKSQLFVFTSLCFARHRKARAHLHVTHITHVDSVSTVRSYYISLSTSNHEVVRCTGHVTREQRQGKSGIRCCGKEREKEGCRLWSGKKNKEPSSSLDLHCHVYRWIITWVIRPWASCSRHRKYEMRVSLLWFLPIFITWPFKWRNIFVTIIDYIFKGILHRHRTLQG